MSTEDTHAARQGSESNDLLGPVAEVKCGRLRWAIPRDDYRLSLRFLNNDTHPLYHQAALDAAVAEANRRQNAAWKLMCERMVAAERERIAKHFDDRDKGTGGYYEPHEPAEIIRALKA